MPRGRGRYTGIPIESGGDGLGGGSVWCAGGSPARGRAGSLLK